MTAGKCLRPGARRAVSQLATVVASTPRRCAVFFWVSPRSSIRFFKWSAKVLRAQGDPGLVRSSVRVTLQKGNAGMTAQLASGCHVSRNSMLRRTVRTLD